MWYRCVREQNYNLDRNTFWYNCHIHGNPIVLQCKIWWTDISMWCICTRFIEIKWLYTFQSKIRQNIFDLSHSFQVKLASLRAVSIANCVWSIKANLISNQQQFYIYRFIDFCYFTSAELTNLWLNENKHIRHRSFISPVLWHDENWP